jgi:N-acetylmuramoyl-L-alanine amidase
MIKILFDFIQNLFKIQSSSSSIGVPIKINTVIEEDFIPESPTTITKLETPNKEKPSKDRNIKYVIVHSTGGTATSSIDWFKNPKAQASAHYLIDKKGNLYIFAEDNFITWHAGKSKWGADEGLNSISIGIELENLNNGIDSYSKNQIQIALKLCIDLAKKYGISRNNILRHLDVAIPPGRKSDPVNFPWDAFIRSISRFLDS